MRIKKDDSLAVIIDMQEKLYPHIFENEKLTANTLKLIKGLKALDIKILVTEQYSKGLGSTIEPIKDVLGKCTNFEKMTFSCCGVSSFNEALENSGKKNIIIAGIESHVCVLQTVLDLLNKNYQPVLNEDCVSSRNLNDKRIAVERMRDEGTIISTCESILFELCEVSGNETFKAISKIVK